MHGRVVPPGSRPCAWFRRGFCNEVVRRQLLDSWTLAGVDSLSPGVVEPLLDGRAYVYCDRCASTQDLLDSSSSAWTVAVCDEQTAGRGRFGRPWIAPPGRAVHCSIALRPPAGAPI